jgi:hypothetical protein
LAKSPWPWWQFDGFDLMLTVDVMLKVVRSLRELRGSTTEKKLADFGECANTKIYTS